MSETPQIFSSSFIEVPPEVQEALDSLTHMEVHTLYNKLPPSITIPQLDRFKSAPYKFQRLLLLTSEGEELIFYDDESVVVVSKMQMFFRTRTTLKVYRLQLQPEDMPKSLSYYSITGIEEKWRTVENFVKQHLTPCISSSPKALYEQGHLKLYKFWCGTKLVPPSVRHENIYNHRLTNAVHTPLSKNVWLVIPTANPIIVESSDHPRLEIQVDFTTNETFFLAYHPEPKND